MHAAARARCGRRLLGNCHHVFHYVPSGRRDNCQNCSIDSSGSNVLDVLEARGLIHQIAGDRTCLRDVLQYKRVGVYTGVDPTAPSLHLGHLLPLMAVIWLFNYGHSAVSLIGGGTARVGDPTGRLTSREQQSISIHQKNSAAIQLQLKSLWVNAVRRCQKSRPNSSMSGKWKILNNDEWLKDLNLVDFLVTLGNSTRIGAMLAKDTVKTKMMKGDGMSFAEFTYPLLQAWDWLHMFRTDNVLLQIGGQDQYGNITAGIDAIRHVGKGCLSSNRPGLQSKDDFADSLRQPMGFTVPLLTTSTGQKIGKSAGNAIWLDRTLTSPFDMYGFLLSTSDSDVERYLKLFTFLSLAEISEIMEKHRAQPSMRTAQHLLARELVELVHGAQISDDTFLCHRNAKSVSVKQMLEPNVSSEQNDDGAGAPTIHVAASVALDSPLSTLLFLAGISRTKTSGARMIAQGGVYLAVRSVPESPLFEFVQIKPFKQLTAADLLDGNMIVLRLGKWKVRTIKLV